MGEEDRMRWDARHSSAGLSDGSVVPGLPAVFAPYEDLFPRTGRALDLACGLGATSVWLAKLGLDVCGVDVSPVAVERARRLAAAHRVSDRCRFRVADLDSGLPSGPPADVVICHLFRNERLYRPMAQRLAEGGLLAVAVLSEVDAYAGPLRARPGELQTAFRELSLIAAGEEGGVAWMLAHV